MSAQVERKVSVGDVVVWHEADGRAVNALVTAVWSQICINLVIVSLDDAKQDGYGRQIERRTSCSYKDQMHVHGFYWRYVDDEPNSYAPPEQI